jgi:hypothetical protein
MLVPAAVTSPLASLLDVPRGLAQVLGFGILIGAATGSFLSVDWAFTIDVIPRDEAGRFLGFSNIATAGACRRRSAHVIASVSRAGPQRRTPLRGDISVPEARAGPK